MMNKTLLLVEDVDLQRQEFATALRERGWIVDEAATGEQALNRLRLNQPYAAVVLDLILPGMHGFDVVDQAKAEGLTVPSVFVVSAYLNDAAWRRLVEHRIEGLLPKPLGPELFALIVDAFLRGNETALVNLPNASSGWLSLASESLQLYFVDYGGRRGYLYRKRTDSDIEGLKELAEVSRPESLNDKVQRRETALNDYFTKHAQCRSELETAEPLLVVARRWSSWYPSFFNVGGGAYAVIGAQAAPLPTPGAIIDPGFRSLSVLEQLGVPVGLLKTCVVTHNHPDHVGGFFEYVTSRHVLGESTSVFCGKSVKALMDTYRGDGLDLQELDQNSFDLIPPYKALDAERQMVAIPVATSHLDAGPDAGTCGLLIKSEVSNRPGAFGVRSAVFLLGDTEYDPRLRRETSPVFDRMREMFEVPKLRVVVFHIGCSQLKQRTGKHLYLTGLIDILRDLDHARRTRVEDDDAQPVLVLVSEWGLEHATGGQLRKAQRDADSSGLAEKFGPDNLVLETIRVIEELTRFERIKLLPADVGLIVGMESGHVYINGKHKTPPGDVIVDYDDQGLVYRRKTD
jgi:CheY-like chemotaxis protein